MCVYAYIYIVMYTCTYINQYIDILFKPTNEELDASFYIHIYTYIYVLTWIHIFSEIKDRAV